MSRFTKKCKPNSSGSGFVKVACYTCSTITSTCTCYAIMEGYEGPFTQGKQLHKYSKHNHYMPFCSKKNNLHLSPICIVYNRIVQFAECKIHLKMSKNPSYVLITKRA